MILMFDVLYDMLVALVALCQAVKYEVCVTIRCSGNGNVATFREFPKLGVTLHHCISKTVSRTKNIFWGASIPGLWAISAMLRFAV